MAADTIIQLGSHDEIIKAEDALPGLIRLLETGAITEAAGAILAIQRRKLRLCPGLLGVVPVFIDMIRSGEEGVNTKCGLELLSHLCETPEGAPVLCRSDEITAILIRLVKTIKDRKMKNICLLTLLSICETREEYVDEGDSERFAVHRLILDDQELVHLLDSMAADETSYADRLIQTVKRSLDPSCD
ncbi:unnamed protein product [Linum trigynum]